MPYRRSYVKKRRRRHGKALFYAGIKSDGTPRGWTILDIAIAALCIGVILFALFFFLHWIWDATFVIGK